MDGMLPLQLCFRGNPSSFPRFSSNISCLLTPSLCAAAADNGDKNAGAGMRRPRPMLAKPIEGFTCVRACVCVCCLLPPEAGRFCSHANGLLCNLISMVLSSWRIFRQGEPGAAAPTCCCVPEHVSVPCGRARMGAEVSERGRGRSVSDFRSCAGNKQLAAGANRK